MNFFIRFVIAAYSRGLNLYPRRFRDQFAGEMQTVFRDSLEEATQEGVAPLVLVASRELMGMPLHILKEVLHEVQGGRASMENAAFPSWKPGSWGDTIWAGLPHLLIAILVAVTGAVVNTRLATLSGILFALLLLAGFLATVYYTWKKRWPAWSASWYGYLGLIIFLVAILPSQSWNPPIGQLFHGVGQWILLLLTLGVLLYWLTRRNPIEGLLMAMPLIILYWLPVMEFVANSIRFWLTFWIFLLSALTAMTITRLNNIQKAVWLVLGASVLSGLPIAYARTYWHNYPVEYSSPPTVGGMIELFSVPWLSSGALVLGPIVGWGVWYIGKKLGEVGRAGALFIICGLIVNLVGHFSYWWQFSRQTYLNALQISAIYQPSERSSTLMVFAGLIMMLIGAISLAIMLWRENKLLSVALILSPLALPWVVMFSIYFGYYIVPPGFSFEFGRLSDVYKYLILLLGAFWLVISGWTVVRLYNPWPDKEAV